MDLCVRVLCLLACAALLSSCGGSGGSTSNPPPDKPDVPVSTDWKTILNDVSQPLDRRKAAALDGIKQDVCFDQPVVTSCDWQQFSAGPEALDARLANSEAILIFDDVAPSIEMLRNRRRIAGFYGFDHSGALVQTPMQWRVPAVFGEILSAFASVPFIPSEDLADVGESLQKKYGEDVSIAGTHGLAVYDILVDLAPDQPILFLSNRELPFTRAMPETFCSVRSASPDDASLIKLRQYSQTVAAHLREMFLARNVRYINASWGFTLASVRDPWPGVCGSPVPDEDILLAILDAYRPVFDALFNTTGVFTAHAAIISDVDSHFPFDQKSAEFPNRLRVGFFVDVGESVPDGGLVEVPAAFNPSPAGDDADVFVNVGCAGPDRCRPARPLSISGGYGMGRAPFPIPQTSFISPVLLSHFIYERNLPQFAGAWLDNALIRQLMDRIRSGCAAGENRCIYIDPLLHRQYGKPGS